MIYIDSSVLVAYCLGEDTAVGISKALESQKNNGMVTSVFSLLEIESAFQRRLNNKEISSSEAKDARSLILQFRKKMSLVPLDELVLGIGLNLQKLYQLRPGDAAQLASASYCHPRRKDILFFSLDEELSEAAAQEGFEILYL